MQTFVPATGFSWLLPWYDFLVAKFTREQEFKAHLLDHALLKPGSRLLDIGCGSGTLLALASMRQTHIQLEGLDVDERILARARTKLEQSSPAATDQVPVKLGIANATNLPCPDDHYDVVVTSLLFHHLLAKEKLCSLLEIRRVLAPGGKLLLADYCRASHALAAIRFLPVRLLDGWCRTACNAAGKLPRLIVQAGLDHVQETLTLETPLGTMRCYTAYKSEVSQA